MSKEKQKIQLTKWLTWASLGTAALVLTGCVDPYPPPAPRAQVYTPGVYSYYDYPDTYVYYDNNGYPSAYSRDPDLRYDAQNRAPDHSDDHNFHNRSDFDHWDY